MPARSPVHPHLSPGLRGCSRVPADPLLPSNSRLGWPVSSAHAAWLAVPWAAVWPHLGTPPWLPPAAASPRLSCRPCPSPHLLGRVSGRRDDCWDQWIINGVNWIVEAANIIKGCAARRMLRTLRPRSPLAQACSTTPRCTHKVADPGGPLACAHQPPYPRRPPRVRCVARHAGTRTSSWGPTPT